MLGRSKPVDERILALNQVIIDQAALRVGAGMATLAIDGDGEDSCF